MNNWEFILKSVVAFAAVVGMVLGIVNFLRQLWSDRVKVKIVPLAAHYQGQGYNGKEVYLTNSEAFLKDGNPPESVAFRVTNLSLFPIKIRDIGFMPKRSNRRHSIYSPKSEDGEEWPRKMESRTSATFYSSLTQIMEAVDITQLKSVYVSTDCGEMFRGKSPAFRQMVEYFKNGA